MTAALKPVRLWCLLGFFLTGAFVAFFLLLMLRPGLVEGLLGGGLRLLGRFLRAERIQTLQRGLAVWMDQYRGAARRFLRKGLLGRVMLYTILQRSLLFAVPWLVMRSFGIPAEPGTVMTLQAMISLGSDLLPLPGGMGASETMFLKIYPGLCGADKTLPVLLVSRGLSYYGQLLISAVFTLAALLILGRRKERRA